MNHKNQKESCILLTNWHFHPSLIARFPFHHGWNARSDVERGSHRVFGKIRIAQVKIRVNSAVPAQNGRVLNPWGLLPLPLTLPLSLPNRRWREWATPNLMLVAPIAEAPLYRLTLSGEMPDFLEALQVTSGRVLGY